MMKSKKLFLGAGVVLIAGLVWLIVWYSSTVPLKIRIDQSSTIKTGLVATTSKDNHRKIHKLPYNPRVKPGTYTITAWGNGAAVVTETVTVERGKENQVQLRFREVTGEDFERLYTGENATDIPYLELFPYETVDYLIKAEVNETVITQLIIVVKHRFTVPSDTAGYAEERRIVSEQARQWLKDNGIPDTIPVTIKDEN